MTGLIGFSSGYRAMLTCDALLMLAFGRPDQTWAVSIPAIRRQNRFLRAIHPGAAHPGWAIAGANLMPWRNFLFANAVSSAVWAVSYGYAAYWLGGEFERLQGRMVVPLVFIAVIALIAGGIFVRRREAQLTTEAERAIPGSLELH